MKYGIYGLVAVFVVVRLALRLRTRSRRRAESGAAASAPTASSSPLAGLSAAIDRVGGSVGLVARREIRERMKGRTFRIATLVVLLVVAAAITIPVVTKGKQSTQYFGVVGTLSPPLRATVVATGSALNMKLALVTEPTLAQAERELRGGKLVAVLDGTKRIVVNQSYSASDTSNDAVLVRYFASAISLQAGLEHAGIPPRQAAVLAHPRPLPVTSLKAPERNQPSRTTAVYGLILTYVLLTQYGTWLLMGVVEEKSSRVIEVLLSTLRARQLLAGKVIGIGTVAMVQAALIVAVALGLGAAEGSTLLHGTAPLVVASSLVWVVLGYAFYCWVYAAGGSLADRQEQVQSLAFPLQLPILIGYIISLVSLGSGGATTLIKVLAYLPPTAPFAMQVLVGVGAATWWEFGLSVLITLGGIVLVSRLAALIYNRAVLRTGGRVHLREILAAES